MSNKAALAAFSPPAFAGDPHTQTREGAAPTYGTRATRQRGVNMMPRARLTSAMSAAAPVQQFTPDQEWFRANAVGRWQADAPMGAHAPAYGVKRHSDGTLDVVRLEPDGSAWIDLGGKGGVDTAVGRFR